MRLLISNQLDNFQSCHEILTTGVHFGHDINDQIIQKGPRPVLKNILGKCFNAILIFYTVIMVVGLRQIQTDMPANFLDNFPEILKQVQINIIKMQLRHIISFDRQYLYKPISLENCRKNRDRFFELHLRL